MTSLLTVLVLSIAAAADISGTWNMGLEGDHVIPTALVLKQDGTALTGTIALPTSRVGQRLEIKLAGELVDGAIKLSGTIEEMNPPATIVITGKVQDDGSLAGRVSMRDHDMSWTAERLKERK